MTRNPDPAILVTMLTDPAAAEALSAAEWSVILPRLRQSGLLGALAARLCGDPESSPRLPIVDQLVAARRQVERQNIVISNEISKVGEVLEGIASKPVLLKGSAYLAMGLPNAKGRFSSDLDLMVKHSELAVVEERLVRSGWDPANRSEYDQRYYRDWMHEVPPMRHRERGTYLDLHHAITPPVSRLSIPSEPLFEAAVPVPGTPFHALSPPDMVLHSACHLLSNGEFSHGLRDFLDIHLLIDHFSRDDPAFWQVLLERSTRFRVTRVLAYTLSFTGTWFGTRLPDDVWPTISGAVPAGIVGQFMGAVIRRAVLAGIPPSAADRFAGQFMIARSHYLRMPLTLLIPHLARKSFYRVRPAPAPSQPVQ